MKTTLAFIVLMYNDIEKAALFYSGIGFNLTEEKHGLGPKHYSFQTNGGLVVELYPTRSDIEPSRVFIGFYVKNLSHSLLTTTATGGSVVSEPVETERGLRAVVKDPGGYKLELIELN